MVQLPVAQLGRVAHQHHLLAKINLKKGRMRGVEGRGQGGVNGGGGGQRGRGGGAAERWCSRGELCCTSYIRGNVCPAFNSMLLWALGCCSGGCCTAVRAAARRAAAQPCTVLQAADPV